MSGVRHQHTTQQHVVQRLPTGGATVRGDVRLRPLLADLEEQRDDLLVDRLQGQMKVKVHVQLMVKHKLAGQLELG